MLVARERFDKYDLPMYDLPSQHKVKKIRKINIRTKAIYCGIILLTLCLAFLVTAKYAQIASMGYDIVSLKKQVQGLNKENEALQYKIDQLKSLENVEYIATTRLGMEKPELAEGVQFVPVEYSKTRQPDNVGIALAEEEVKKPRTQQRNSLVQALVKMING